MPLDKKSLSFLHHLQTAYAPDESSMQSLTQHLPLWTEQYKKVFEELFDQIKREKKTSRSLKSSLLSFSDDLRLRLSDQLPERDLLKILTEALLLSYILKEEEWQELIQHAHLSSLAAVIQVLNTSLKENSTFDTLQKISKEVSDHLTEELQRAVWQHLHHIQHNNPVSPVLSQKASHRLLSFLNYLLKRKLGLSLNDEDVQVLWLYTLESHWEQSLLSFIEPDLQEKTFAERMISCKISLMDFGLTYPTYFNRKQTLSDRKPCIYWQEPLHSLEQGIQTNLFSSMNQVDTLSAKLKGKSFSCIILDLRHPLHPYRYARKIQSIDQHILHAYQNLGIEEPSLGLKERMLDWSLEKIGEQGILLAIVTRNVLEEAESQSFRQFLVHTFQEVHVVDTGEQEEEGLALLYLVKKSIPKKEQGADVQYARLSFQQYLEDHHDFESLSWQKVKTHQQNYWIALPESDFFTHYPVFGTEEAIFKSQVKGLQSFQDEWLMDDDAKLLEKKVKYFLKQLNRASQKSKEAPDPDIKWTEALKKISQEEPALSFDKQKIKKLQIQPFVYAFVYAEEKLLLDNDAVAPAILFDSDLKQVFPLNQSWHERFSDHFLAFPLKKTEPQQKIEENISDAALEHFHTYYQKLSKNFDQTFIVFPPENITHILDKMEAVSRDLPVIRKYPNQIGRLLEEARHFTSDVELLTPPYEKIEEFRYKVLRLEKDAIERKIIYQKVKTYIEELKEQLASLTHEHDEARKDYEAVHKENIFYYSCAVLYDPRYRKKYQAYLERELPRIPLLPKFRQWVQWGKDLFQAHQFHAEPESISSKIQVKEETHEQSLSKSFTYEMDEERGVIILKEQFLQITLSNIPKEAWNVQLGGRTPFVHYLDYLSQKTSRNKKTRVQFTQPRLADKAHIIANLKHLCGLSSRLSVVESEMQKAHF